MKITREDAEAWYRGEEGQTASAHQVATFYRAEMLKAEALTAEAVAKEAAWHDEARRVQRIIDDIAKEACHCEPSYPECDSEICKCQKLASAFNKIEYFLSSKSSDWLARHDAEVLRPWREAAEAHVQSCDGSCYEFDALLSPAPALKEEKP